MRFSAVMETLRTAFVMIVDGHAEMLKASA
jgi:hypothetical protein